MNALISMVAVRALPPPPEPAGSPAIDTAKVVGIVLVSLGLIALVTLLLRPLVVRRHTRPAAPLDEPPLPDEPVEPLAEPFAERGIIRFPAPFAADSAGGWQVNDPTVADRFQRVVGQRDRRRKLGDRNPGRAFGSSDQGRERRQREPGQSYLPRHQTQPIGTVIPIYDRPAARAAGARATGTSERSAAEPPSERPDRVWTEPQPGARPLDRARDDHVRRPLAPARRERDGERAQPPFPPEAASIPGHEFVVETARALAETPVADRAVDEPPQAAPAPDTVDLPAEPSAPITADGWIVTEAPAWAETEPAEIAAPGDAGHRDAADANAVDTTDASLPQTDQLVFETAHADALHRERDAERTAPPEPPVAPELAVAGEEIDPETLREITLAIRELIFCANTGEVLRGLALYSDDHLFRFMDSTGMSEEEFREAFAVAHPRAPETWERLDTLRDPARLPDGRIEVTASYVDPRGVPANGLERYRFVYEPNHRLWMIDDIIQLPTGE